MTGPPDPTKTNPPEPMSLAAEVQGGGTEDLTSRLARYGTAKARARSMASYLVTVEEMQLAGTLYDCGSYLVFRDWLAHQRTTLHAARFCKRHLLCPLCAIRRGGKMLRNYLPRVEHLNASGLVPWMFTLTVKNGPDLAERYRHLTSSFRRLRDRALRRGSGPFASVEAYVASIEVKKGSGSGLWHPHLHGIVWLPPGATFDRAELSATWLAVTGDSHQVECHAMTGEPVDAMCEVFKYALKFSDMTPEDTYRAHLTLRGRRLVRSGGCLYGLELPDSADLTDDPLDGPYIERFYRYASRGYVPDGLRIGHEESTIGGTPQGPEDADLTTPQRPAQEHHHARAG